MKAYLYLFLLFFSLFFIVVCTSCKKGTNDDKKLFDTINYNISGVVYTDCYGTPAVNHTVELELDSNQFSYNGKGKVFYLMKTDAKGNYHFTYSNITPPGVYSSPVPSLLILPDDSFQIPIGSDYAVGRNYTSQVNITLKDSFRLDVSLGTFFNQYGYFDTLYYGFSKSNYHFIPGPFMEGMIDNWNVSPGRKNSSDYGNISNNNDTISFKINYAVGLINYKNGYLLGFAYNNLKTIEHKMCSAEGSVTLTAP